MSNFINNGSYTTGMNYFTSFANALQRINNNDFVIINEYSGDITYFYGNTVSRANGLVQTDGTFTTIWDYTITGEILAIAKVPNYDDICVLASTITSGVADTLYVIKSDGTLYKTRTLNNNIPINSRYVKFTGNYLSDYNNKKIYNLRNYNVTESIVISLDNHILAKNSESYTYNGLDIYSITISSDSNSIIPSKLFTVPESGDINDIFIDSTKSYIYVVINNTVKKYDLNGNLQWTTSNIDNIPIINVYIESLAGVDDLYIGYLTEYDSSFIQKIDSSNGILLWTYELDRILSNFIVQEVRHATGSPIRLYYSSYDPYDSDDTTNNDINIDIIMGNTRPYPSTSLTYTGGNYNAESSINVSWNGSIDIDGGVLKYELDLYNGNTWTNVATNITTKTTSIVLPKINATGCKFRVRTFDGKEYSLYKTSTTIFNIIINTAPSVPSTITYPSNIDILGNTEVSISWETSTDAESNSITYEVDLYNGTAWSNIGTYSTNSATYILPKIIGNGCKFRVRAYDGKLYSNYIEGNTFNIILNTTPSIPINIVYPDGIILGESNIEISWDVSIDNENDSITYEVDLYNGTSWANIGTYNTNLATYNIPNVDLIGCKFRVRSYDGKLYSNYTEGTTIFNIFSKNGHLVTNSGLFSILSSFLTFIRNKISTAAFPTKISELNKDVDYKTIDESSAIIDPIIDESKTFTNNAIATAGIVQFTIIKVDSLPTKNIKNNTLYMLKTSTDVTDNNYYEYTYIDNAWEKLGTVSVDLSPYNTSEEISSKILNLNNLNNGISEAEILEINNTIWS